MHARTLGGGLVPTLIFNHILGNFLHDAHDQLCQVCFVTDDNTLVEA